MATEKIKISVGQPVENNDFYGRKKELQYAWENHILGGASLLLSAPRRVGKSSFAKRMLKLAEDNGWKTLYLDLQGISTESDFVKLFKAELQKEEWWKKEISTKNKIAKLFKD
jgi:AAA+ ATPase superfamily predicted ATPase